MKFAFSFGGFHDRNFGCRVPRLDLSLMHKRNICQALCSGQRMYTTLNRNRTGEGSSEGSSEGENPPHTYNSEIF